jgi:Spy/CpxP family protein refolding chaperone
MALVSYLRQRAARTAFIALLLTVIAVGAAAAASPAPTVLPVEPDGGIGGEVVLPVESDGGIGN